MLNRLMMSLLSAALITKLDHFKAAGSQQNPVSQQNLSPVIVSVGSVFPSKPPPAHILCLTVKVKVRLALIREFPGYINGSTLSCVSIFSVCSGPGLLESIQHISADDKEGMCRGRRLRNM